MERENMFLSEGFGNLHQSTEMTEQQFQNCFFNPNWENSVDQNDPFESALSSMVSSPAASNAAAGGVPGNVRGGGGEGEHVVLRELIGRLGSICNSGEISPESYVGGNASTNNSCYSTPLNSPPKLNLSMMDHQIRRNLPISGHHLPNHPNFAPFPADPGFAERAARFSCFANRSLGSLTGPIGLNDSEILHQRMVSSTSGKLSRVSSNQSMKISCGSQLDVAAQEKKDGCLQDVVPFPSDRKFSKLSRSSTPENAEFGDSRENSSLSEQITGGGETATNAHNDANSRKRKSVPKGKAKEQPSSSNSAKAANAAAVNNNESNPKRSKSTEENANDKGTTKSNADKDKGDGNEKQNKDNSKPAEPPKDYIHVRARRGQATDAHSLAERVRREKISERMKLLQDLVPGCNKVTGKAVMLDEIINYVQSLQRQVEFLSMKLATINPRMEFNMESLLSKDGLQPHGSMHHNIYQSETSPRGFPLPIQSPNGANFASSAAAVMPNNGQELPFSMNHLNGAIGRNQGIHLPPLDNFGESASQISSFWEDDLHTVVQMGFGQNQTQNFQGILPTTQMKVEN